MGMETIARMIMANNSSLPGVNDFTQGAQGMQQMLNGQLEYAQARDNYEAMKGLRALFAQNPNPDIGQIGALSPEFAQKTMINNMLMGEKMLGMRKTEKEMGNIDSQQLERDAKLWAPMTGALAEQYLDQPNSPEFRRKLGELIAEGQKQGLSIAPGFNIETMTADQLLNIAISRGYKSPSVDQRYEIDTESQKRGLPPTPTAEQAYGHGSIDQATGQPLYTPPVVGQPPASAWSRGRTAPRGRGGHIMPRPGSLPQNFNGPVPPDFQQQPMTVQDVEAIRQHAESLPPGPEKAQAMALYEQARRQMPNDADDSISEEPDERTPPGYASPKQVQEARIQQKSAEAQATAEAQDSVSRKSQSESKLSILESIKPVKEIEELIDKSMSSGIESRIKNVTSGVLGVRDEAYDASKQLKQIEGQLRPIMMGIIGAGAASDKEQSMVTDALGNFANPDASPESRKASLGILLNFARASIQKYPDLNQRLRNLDGKQMTKAVQHTPRAQALIDRHTSGELSDEQFRQEWNAMPEEEY